LRSATDLAASSLHKLTGRTAGNGSLMRTAPLALAYLDDEAALVEAARAVSELTHYDPEAGDACVLWCLAIRHAVLTGELDARIGLRHIEVERRDLWGSRLAVAEASQPSNFKNNAGVVEALQAAWSAITTTLVPQDDPAVGVFRVDHLRLALDAAVRGGNDTDTTPSQLPRADCSALPMKPRQFPRSGVACCTAGPGWRPGTWWRWAPES
jgi:ADP-ribosylglycohydrolase